MRRIDHGQGKVKVKVGLNLMSKFLSPFEASSILTFKAKVEDVIYSFSTRIVLNVINPNQQTTLC